MIDKIENKNIVNIPNKESETNIKDNEAIHPKNGENKDVNIQKNPNENLVEDDNNNTEASKHGKCVPLTVYQKVYDDKQKLISQLNMINNQLKSSKSKDNINIISSLQNEVKNMEREKKILENIVIKQEKSINNLQNKIIKYEKQINKKNEELLVKEDIINELKEKINELVESNKSIKNNCKINERKEIIKLNDIINNLKNELELNEKKLEFNNIKFNNLQNKYLRLFQQKKKIENESLLKLSKEQLATSRAKNNYNTPNKNIKIYNNLNTNNEKANDLVNNLPLINDINSSITLPKDINNKRYFKKNKNIDIKESYSMTNND